MKFNFSLFFKEFIIYLSIVFGVLAALVGFLYICSTCSPLVSVPVIIVIWCAFMAFLEVKDKN